MKTRVVAVVGVAAVALIGCVLSLYAGTEAAPPSSTQPLPPFAQSVQRQVDVIGKLDEVVAQLKEQNALLKEQNDFLKSGKLEVVIKK